MPKGYKTFGRFFFSALFAQNCIAQFPTGILKARWTLAIIPESLSF
jgi:hypothetical protein